MKNIIISTKNLDLNDEINDYIYDKVNIKILPQIDNNVKVKVFLQKLSNNTYKCDIDVRVENIKINSCENNTDIFICIKNTVNSIHNKVRKINKKIRRKNTLKDNKQISKLCDDIFIVNKNTYLNKDNSFENLSSDKYSVINDNQFEFVKSKRLDLKPMSAVEAVLQMNLIGHNFFLFLNSKTNEKTVVYKRKDGKYGIID